MMTWTETTLDLDLGMWLTYACFGPSLMAPTHRELVAAALAEEADGCDAAHDAHGGRS